MNAESKEAIISRIRRHLPGARESNFEIREDMLLSDLGIQSVHLISLLLALQAENAVDIDRMDKVGMPVTVGDLIRAMEKGA